MSEKKVINFAEAKARRALMNELDLLDLSQCYIDEEYYFNTEAEDTINITVNEESDK